MEKRRRNGGGRVMPERGNADEKGRGIIVGKRGEGGIQLLKRQNAGGGMGIEDELVGGCGKNKEGGRYAY